MRAVAVLHSASRMFDLPAGPRVWARSGSTARFSTVIASEPRSGPRQTVARTTKGRRRAVLQPKATSFGQAGQSDKSVLGKIAVERKRVCHSRLLHDHKAERIREGESLVCI